MAHILNDPDVDTVFLNKEQFYKLMNTSKVIEYYFQFLGHGPTQAEKNVGHIKLDGISFQCKELYRADT